MEMVNKILEYILVFNIGIIVGIIIAAFRLSRCKLFHWNGVNYKLVKDE